MNSRRRSCSLSLLAALLLSWGCVTDAEPALDTPDAAPLPADDMPDDTVDGLPHGPIEVTPRFAPAGEGFYRMPWPSDLRLNAQGGPDLTDFPRANGGLLRTYRAVLEALDGFATMPVIYVGMDGLIPAEAMPTPQQTMEASGAVQLIDVSARGCGERVPLIVTFDAVGDNYIDANTLRASPLPGYVLRPATPYALVVQRSLGATHEVVLQHAPSFPEVLEASPSGDGDVVQAYAPLRDCLAQAALAPEQIAVASVFTTQDPTRQTRLLRDVVADPARVQAPRVTEWELVNRNDRFVYYKGVVEMPIFQRGESPYNMGGGLVFGEDGLPEVQRYEAAPFTLALPLEPMGPVPILLWSDGTGASQFSHLSAAIIANTIQLGFGVLNFVPQFHDTRAPDIDDPTLATFNYFNPESGRTVFRQQAAESLYMLRVLREYLAAHEDLPELRTDRVLYGGHSQGAIIGAMLAGVTDAFAAYGLNGIGAYLSSTIVYRKDYTDIERTLRTLLNVGREMDRFHPIIQLAQLGVEAVDPHNYAPSWRGIEGEFDGVHVFMTNGDMDETTAPRGIDAITVAGDVDIMQEASWDVEPFGVWGRSPVPAPLRANRLSVAGTPLTQGAFLLQGGGHFTIYRNARSRQLMTKFWDSAREGAPTLE